MLTESNAGDTKAGTLVAIDRYGNKYFENNEELPRTSYITLELKKKKKKIVMLTCDEVRTRWVDYKDHDHDASHIDPGW